MNPELVLEWLLWAGLWAVPCAAGLWLAYFLLSLPLRRQERAGLFLDMLETSLQAGQTPEQGFTALANTQDRALGVRLHWLAALIASGIRLEQALATVPGALPPRLNALLQVGLRLNDLRRILPVCRRLNQDAGSSVLGASNYLILVLIALSPVAPTVLILLSVFVVPKFIAILEEMDVPPPALLEVVVAQTGWFTLAMAMILTLLYGVTILYIGGPRLAQWFRGRLGGPIDQCSWCIPWKRRRLKRDFTTLLATLLDAGIPEPEAVRVAADATDHAVLRARARAALNSLAEGQTLPAALRALDESGELEWRVRNAAVGRVGFLDALRGWLDALDAQAFQQEQAAAQGITSGLVLFHGLVVGLIVVAVYQPLIQLIEHAVLW